MYTKIRWVYTCNYMNEFYLSICKSHMNVQNKRLIHMVGSSMKTLSHFPPYSGQTEIIINIKYQFRNWKKLKLKEIPMVICIYFFAEELWLVWRHFLFVCIGKCRSTCPSQMPDINSFDLDLFERKKRF